VDSPIPQRVLVFDRTSQNRAKTALLVTVAILLTVPFIGAIGWGAYAVLGRLTTYTAPLDADYRSYFDRQREMMTTLGQMDEQEWAKFDAEFKRLYQAEQSREISAAKFQREILRLVNPEKAAKMDQQELDSGKTRTLFSVIIALAVAAILAILFQSIVSSPGSKALALCGARPAGPDEAETKRSLENLAAAAGLPPPKLYVIESSGPNAFATGMDPERSTVAVTSGLLALLDREEIEGVLAHELSHIGNRDTRLDTTVFAITLLLRLPMLLWKSGGTGRKEEAASATEAVAGRVHFRIWNWVVLPAYVYIFFVAPFLALLIRAAISRSREFLADADAALLTGQPEGLLRALAKIAGAGSLVEGSNPLVSHLYFASPSAAGGGLGIFSGNLLASHPPVRERMTRLVELGATAPPSVIDQAVKAGETWGAAHPARVSLMMTEKPPDDELTVLANADTRSRVYRVLGSVPVALYERDDPSATVIAQVKPGALLVGFEYHSKMRQVVVASTQSFGYIPRAARLEPLDMHPDEAFNASREPDPPLQPPPQPAPLAVGAVAATASVRVSPQRAPLVAPPPAAQAAPAAPEAAAPASSAVDSVAEAARSAQPVPESAPAARPPAVDSVAEATQSVAATTPPAPPEPAVAQAAPVAQPVPGPAPAAPAAESVADLTPVAQAAPESAPAAPTPAAESVAEETQPPVATTPPAPPEPAVPHAAPVAQPAPEPAPAEPAPAADSVAEATRPEPAVAEVTRIARPVSEPAPAPVAEATQSPDATTLPSQEPAAGEVTPPAPTPAADSAAEATQHPAATTPPAPPEPAVAEVASVAQPVAESTPPAPLPAASEPQPPAIPAANGHSGLTPGQTLAAALLGILGVGAVLVGVVLLLRALSG
jgi:heat shock protein HtpX